MGTTAMSYSAKAEFALAAHCFAATVSSLTCTCSTTVNMTAISSTGISGLAVGMLVTGGTGLPPAGTIIAAFVGQNALTLSAASTGAFTAPTFTGDTFKMLLIKSSPAGTYIGSQTNVGTPGSAGSGDHTLTNVGTDEASGTGYTSGGFTLTNIQPAVGTTAAFWSFTTNPSWTSATLSVSGANIYNATTTPRLGFSANGIAANSAGSAINRCISYHDFGGTQSVTAGTLTVVLPANSQGNAILQIS